MIHNQRPREALLSEDAHDQIIIRQLARGIKNSCHKFDRFMKGTESRGRFIERRMIFQIWIRHDVHGALLRRNKGKTRECKAKSNAVDEPHSNFLAEALLHFMCSNGGFGMSAAAAPKRQRCTEVH